VKPDILRGKLDEVEREAEAARIYNRFVYDFIQNDEGGVREAFRMQDGGADEILFDAASRALKTLEQDCVRMNSLLIRHLKPGEEVDDPLSRLGLMEAVQPDYAELTEEGTQSHRYQPSEAGEALIDELRRQQGRISIKEERKLRQRGAQALGS
jgi:hypothetical protein